MLSPAEYSLRGRIGAFGLHATHDPRITTIPARRAFLQRFLDAVPADLPEQERQRRAGYLRRAYFCRLALKSVEARRRRRGPETLAEYMQPGEAGRILGVTRIGIHHLIEKGKLPAIRTPKGRYILRDAVEALAKERGNPGAS